MKIVLSLLLFLAGLGMIAYSYIGAFLAIGSQLDAAETPLSAYALVMGTLESIAAGDIPRLTPFLYVGLLLIVFAIVNLIRKRRGA